MSNAPAVVRRVIAALAVLVLAASCDPVTHTVTPDATTFEGFTVYSSIPDDPVGIVYVFHGSGGSAEIANKIEPIDQLNAFVEAGYGWVATESTERNGDRRWQVFDPSLTTNPDLARLTRLHDELIATTPVTVDTPMFGIGMSNGARMVTLFGQAFSDAGYPVAAVAPFMGTAAPSVRNNGGLTVPGFWVIAENDTVVDNDTVIADQAANAANGVASSLTVKYEEPLFAERFLRIPAIDEQEADAIHTALLDTGVWNGAGQRVLPLEQAIPLILALDVPPSFGATPSELRNQVQAGLAMHQFVGLFRTAVVDFFDAQLPSTPG